MYIARYADLEFSVQLANLLWHDVWLMYVPGSEWRLFIYVFGWCSFWGMCSPWSFTLHNCSVFMTWLIVCSLTRDQARCLNMTHQCQWLKQLQSLLGLSPSCQRARFWQRLSTVTGDRHSLPGMHAEHCSKTMAKCSSRLASQQELLLTLTAKPNAWATCLCSISMCHYFVVMKRCFSCDWAHWVLAWCCAHKAHTHLDWDGKLAHA